MTVKLGFADVILNEGKPSKKMLVITNENDARITIDTADGLSGTGGG